MVIIDVHTYRMYTYFDQDCKCMYVFMVFYQQGYCFVCIGASAAFSYAHSKGLFAGVSLEASVIAARHDVNRQFYGMEVTPAQLLSGEIPGYIYISTYIRTILPGVYIRYLIASKPVRL
jgi:hypothetical protein